MSGHSKWSTIKRQKGVNDTKRGQLFTKLARAITVAAKKGGGDPAVNHYLRKAVEEARCASMPKDNIGRAIEKASGAGEGLLLNEIIVEAYGPMGVAFYINCLTDNRNRTISEIRGVFNKFGGNLAEAGSTSYIFAADPDNPSFIINLDDREGALKLINLHQALEDLDDVQNIYSNFEIAEDALSQLQDRL